MATLAVVGAATGYTLAWLVVLLLPLIAIAQSIAAAVGASGTSIQGAIRTRFGLTCALIALVAVVSVNLLTLAADLEAGAEALTLLSGVPRAVFVLPFAGVVAWLLFARSYLRIERVLTFFPFVFTGYIVSAVLAKPDWGVVARAIVVPHFEFTAPVVTAALALLGTTLTSYVYYWEQIEVSERGTLPREAGSMKRNAAWGALGPAICFLFILIATAATLGKHHTAVQTAADAAAALEPLAGRWATALFAVGLLASAAIAVPILAGTSAYVVTQTFGWRGSLSARVREAPIFYGIVLGSLVLAAALALCGIAPIALLYWASVAGGIATPLTLWLLVAIARSRAIMGGNCIDRRLTLGGSAVAGVVTTACVAFLCLVARGH